MYAVLNYAEGELDLTVSGWGSYLEIVQSVSGDLRFLPKSSAKTRERKMFFSLLYRSYHLLSKNINLFANIEESFCKLIKLFSCNAHRKNMSLCLLLHHSCRNYQFKVVNSSISEIFYLPISRISNLNNLERITKAKSMRSSMF